MTLWFGDAEGRVGVHVEPEALAGDVAALFRPLLLPGPVDAAADFRMERVGRTLVVADALQAGGPWRFRSLSKALDLLEYLVVLRLQARWSHRAVLHGAGVKAPEGSAVLALGPSGAGKSSLALAASLAGHPILADDCLMVDASGRVTGLPRLIKVEARQLRRAGLTRAHTVAPHPRISEVWWDPGGAGGWGTGWHPVSLVARVAWESGRGPPRLTPLGRGEGVRVLLDNLVTAEVPTEAVLDRLLGVARDADFVDLRFHVADEGMRALMALAEGGMP